MTTPAPVRVGIVGVGRMGRRHAENLATRVPGAQLVAACSPIGEELDWARDTLGVPGLYKDYARAAAQPNIDAVFLVTPNTLHPAQIIAALQGRQARVLREAAVAGARRVPGGRGRSGEASRAQGDDRLRAPLRRELPGRAEAASPRAPSAGRSWCARRPATRTIRPASSCVRADVRRHLRRHERARHRPRALAAGLAQGAARVLGRHRRRARGPARLRRRRQRRRDLRVRRRPHGVLLRVAHDGARPRDGDRGRRHRRPAGRSAATGA